MTRLTRTACEQAVSKQNPTEARRRSLSGKSTGFKQYETKYLIQAAKVPSTGRSCLCSPADESPHLALPCLLHGPSTDDRRMACTCPLDAPTALGSVLDAFVPSCHEERTNSSIPAIYSLRVRSTFLSASSFQLTQSPQVSSSRSLSLRRSTLLPPMDLPTPPLPLLQHRPIPLRLLRQKRLALLPLPRLPPPPHNRPPLCPPRPLPIPLPTPPTL
jgi:hypothetical protein